MSAESKKLTSFIDRLANSIMEGTGHRLSNQREEVKQVLELMFRVDGKDSDDHIICVLLGVLIIKHFGIRHSSSTQWKTLVTDRVRSDHWIDCKLFQHFHVTAELPLTRLAAMERMQIEAGTFAAMHQHGIDYKRFLTVMSDFRILLPVLGERVKISRDTFSTDISQEEWHASIFPLIWGLDMVETGPYLSGEHGNHRKITAGLPNRVGVRAEVGPCSFFSNGQMPVGAIFVGGVSDPPYVTILAEEPDNEDFRMTSDFGVQHFQNRFRGLKASANAEVISVKQDELPQIPEVVSLHEDLICIPKCASAHQDALALRQQAVQLRDKASSAAEVLAARNAAQTAFDNASAEVQRLQTALEAAQQLLDQAEQTLCTRQSELNEIGDLETIRVRLSSYAEQINGKLAAIARVQKSLAEVA